MNLKELITHLKQSDKVEIYLADGTQIAPHFHITELANNSKTFLDCGNTLRTERHVGMQLWIAEDTKHRLSSEKLLKVLQHGITTLELDDSVDVRMEYQGNTIETYGIELREGVLTLKTLKTACLALEECGVPTILKKPLLKLSQLSPKLSCTPGGGCC